MTRILLGLILGLMIAAPWANALHRSEMTQEQRQEQDRAHQNYRDFQNEQERFRQEQFRNRQDFDRLNRPC